MHLLHTDDEELMAIAVGHDLIEDTFLAKGQSLQEAIVFLQNEGFTQRITTGIVGMTKLPGQSPAAYRLQVKGSLDTIRVKMADLRHNSDVRRLKGVSQKDLDRVAYYMAFYEELKAEKIRRAQG